MRLEATGFPDGSQEVVEDVRSDPVPDDGGQDRPAVRVSDEAALAWLPEGSDTAPPCPGPGHTEVEPGLNSVSRSLLIENTLE